MFKIIKETDNNIVIRAEKNICIENINIFNEFLRDMTIRSDKNIILDCTSLELLDSSGLSIILKTVNKLKNKNKVLIMSGLHESIINILQTVKFDKLIILKNTIEEAEKFISEAE